MNGVDNNGFYGSEDNDKQMGSVDLELSKDKQIGSVDQEFSIVDVNIKKSNIKTRLNNFKEENKTTINRVLITLLHILVGIYFSWATYRHIYLKKRYLNDSAANIQNVTENGKKCSSYCGIQWCDGYGMLLLIVVCTYLGLIYYKIIKPKWGFKIYQICLLSTKKLFQNAFKNRFLKIGIGIAVFTCIIALLIFDTIDSSVRLRSLLGIFCILAFGYIFSNNRTKIKWRPVLCGFTLQFLLGLFCIRWEVGRNVFKCFGKKVETYLNFAAIGSKFVFGEFLLKENVFAFSVLPVIFFFSFCISILYYYGAMQWFIVKLGWILQTILGSTVCESVICAGNIFLGMSESPLLIMPYVKLLTHSELHAIMTSCLATVSGTVLAAYISFGAEPAHLITSSVMAAPAAICFAKLFYPETEESKTTSENIEIEKSQDSSVLDAASKGATLGISLVLGIIANLVAFVSFVAFLNAILNWFGWLAGFDDLTFEWIFGKLCIPLAWILGVEWNDCENIGKIIANKIIVNEFVAYEKLGEMKANHDITLRSSAIATYAICGFANPSSMGIIIATFSAICNERRPSITAVAFRAFVSGCCVCFITASIAGLLMDESSFSDLNKSRYTR